MRNYLAASAALIVAMLIAGQFAPKSFMDECTELDFEEYCRGQYAERARAPKKPRPTTGMFDLHL